MGLLLLKQQCAMTAGLGAAQPEDAPSLTAVVASRTAPHMRPSELVPYRLSVWSSGLSALTVFGAHSAVGGLLAGMTCGQGQGSTSADLSDRGAGWHCRQGIWGAHAACKAVLGPALQCDTAKQATAGSPRTWSAAA